MMTGLSAMLKGINGSFEINRVVGAFGTVVYVVSAQAFVTWNMLEDRPFDLATYCIAFPGGLAVCVGAIAGAVAIKDRNVATARVIQDTGAAPGLAAEGGPATTSESTA